MKLELKDGAIVRTDDRADEIEVSIAEGLDDELVVVTLRSAPSVTWWKGIHVYGPDDETVIGLLSTTDQDHGPSRRRFRVAELGTRLEFLKARFLGVHTGVGRPCWDPRPLAGHEVVFTWRRD